jgi:hypothetical protein
VRNPDPAGEAWTAELKQTQRKIADHPGTRAYGRRKGFHQVHSILEQNQQVLLMTLDAPNEDQDLVRELFQNVREPIVREAFTQALMTAFHNYMASVKTLVDHTRVIVEGQQDPAFQEEYERHKVVVIDNPLSSFLHRLRNYVLHYGLPGFAQRVSISRAADAPAFELFFDKSALERWDGWTAESRKYLDSQPDQFDLRALVGEYAELIEDLYVWLFEALAQIEEPVGREVDHLIHRYIALLHRGPNRTGWPHGSPTCD